MIYLISEAWSDDMENEISAAFGYTPIGYVLTQKEADRYSDIPLPSGFSWAQDSNFRKYKVKPIHNISGTLC